MSKRKQKDPEAPTSSKKARTKRQAVDEYPLFADVSDDMGFFATLEQKDLLELFLKKLCCYLEPRDILNLTETCKGMNKQISLNAEIMKNIKLTVPAINRVMKIDFGKRLYMNLVYLQHAMSEFKNIREGVKKIAPNLETITFPEKAYFASAVKVLSYMRDIQGIFNFPYRINYDGTQRRTYRAYRHHEEILPDPNPMRFTNLKKLTVDKCGQEIEVFAECDKLEHFGVTGDIFVDRLESFLNKQNCLTSLSFRWPDGFYTNQSSPPNYRLQKLEVNYTGNADDFNHIRVHYERFVGDHRDSLVSFSTDNNVLLPSLDSFPQLREVKYKLYGNFTRNPTLTFPLMLFVKKLEVEFEFKPRKNGNIDHSIFLNFPSLDSFPNLKELRGRKLRSDFIILTHKEIELICLEKSVFADMSMPKLKSVKFIDCKVSKNWLTPFFENPSAKLNMLELKDMKLSTKCRDIIEQNRKKIAILIMD